MPLSPGRKTPAHKGWRQKDYAQFDFLRWQRQGGGIAIRLKDDQAVIDDDPRNHADGDDPICRLSNAIGLDLTTAPTVVTGSGGKHFYLRLPDGVRVKNGSLKDLGYPGIDVKTGGGFVVAPGSLHPENQRPYRPLWCGRLDIPTAPDTLVALVRRPARTERPMRPGVLDPEELAELLAVVDPTAYGKGHYDRWVQFGAACNSACPGGLVEFQEWAAGDPDYATFEDDEVIERMWHSFDPDREGGASYRTLLAAVAEAGHPDLAAKYGSKIDFEAHPVDEHWREMPVQVESAPADPRLVAGLEFQLASEVTIEPIRWLWPNRIACGKVNSVSGEAGLSKTTLMLDIAARVTRGQEWPDGSGQAEPGAVIFLSAEDDPADTLVPRFLAAGGDLGKLIMVKPLVQPEGKQGKRMFNIADDIPRLQALVRRFPDVRLIIIDPIGAYMGSSTLIDTFRDSDVRAALGPLKEFAEATGIAAVFIGHFKKGATGRVQERMMGSVAFTALARCNWVVLSEEDEDERPTGRLLFARSKQNIGEPAGAMAYRIRSMVVDFDRGIAAPAIIWEGSVEGSADTLVARPRRKGESPRLREAIAFLTDLLADGPVPASTVEIRRSLRNISEKTLNRAKRIVGARSEQRDDGWYWVPQHVPIDNDGAGQLGSTEGESGGISAH